MIATRRRKRLLRSDLRGGAWDRFEVIGLRQTILRPQDSSISDCADRVLVQRVRAPLARAPAFPASAFSLLPRLPVRIRAMTWSIVARDRSGAFGVAIASRFFAVGVLCQIGRSGVGALSTQALVNPLYGARALELMAQG